MKSLVEFRTMGAKDKQKRQSHLFRNLAIGAGAAATLGGAAALAHHQGVFSNKIRNKRKIEQRKSMIDSHAGSIDATKKVNNARNDYNNIGSAEWRGGPFATKHSRMMESHGAKVNAAQKVKRSAREITSEMQSRGKKFSAPLVYLNFF